jgi:hypothetical protein
MPPRQSVADLLAAVAAQSPEAQAAAQEAQYKQQQTQQLASIEQSIHGAVAQLVQYLDGKVTKTEVVNQLQQIGTPDALKVVEAVNSLHGTLKTHKNTDLSEITQVMRQVLEEAKKIPKANPGIPEVSIPDYAKQFTGLEAAVRGVEEAVKAQRLEVKPPIVNVKPADVKVDAPDLGPLQTELRIVAEAVRAIVIPEYKAPDNSGVEKLLKSVDARLRDLPDQIPTSRGGGGGGIAAYRGADGNVVQVTLDGAGSVPVMPQNSLVRGRYDYIEFSPDRDNPTTITFKYGGAGGTVVTTLNLGGTSISAS